MADVAHDSEATKGVHGHRHAPAHAVFFFQPEGAGRGVEKKNTGTKVAAYVLIAGVAFIGPGYLAIATDQAGY